MRYANWKLVFEEQLAPDTLFVRANPFTKLRVAKFFDLHADPFERADITSNTYWDWLMNTAYLAYGAQAYVAEFLATFKEFPLSQRAASYTVDQIIEQRQKPSSD